MEDITVTQPEVQETSSKATTALVAVVTLIAGFTGGQTLNNQTIADLNTKVVSTTEQVQLLGDQAKNLASQVDAKEAEKQVILRQKQSTIDTYLYDMIRVGQAPDVSAASVDELNQAYADLVASKGIVVDFHNSDINSIIRQKAQQLGEKLTCN